MRIERAYVVEKKLEAVIRAKENDSLEPGNQIQDSERHDHHKNPEPQESIDAFIE